MVPPFEDLPGVLKIVSGYANGTKENPTYAEVNSGRYGFFEAVQIEFDEKKVTYRELLDIFWRQIDPTDGEGQFADRGKEYMTAIFYHDTNQKVLADISKKEIQKEFDKPIATQIIPFKNFYPAEDYHQDYHRKNPFRYKMYKMGSGRAAFIKKKWDK